MKKQTNRFVDLDEPSFVILKKGKPEKTKTVKEDKTPMQKAASDKKDGNK